MSASAFSLTAMFAAADFEVIQGELVRGGLGLPELSHFFCSKCMTWVFTRPTALPQLVNVRPTLLEDASWFRPFIETCTAARLPWAGTSAIHSFEGFPPMGSFDDLLAEYRAWRASSA